MISVLLVEDNDQDREIFKNKISVCGDIRIDTAKDFLEAVNAVLDYSYDLIITDLNLPGLSGREAVKKFKEMTHHKIPVIAVCDTELKDDYIHSSHLNDQTLPDIFKHIEHH